VKGVIQAVIPAMIQTMIQAVIQAGSYIVHVHVSMCVRMNVSV
jgi:hypothetical protein